MKYIFFISGPTASGKTDFSLDVAKELMEYGIPAQIINADIGQFYKPLAIGTAKPDWKASPIPHHLFDIVDEPKDFNVVSYRKLLLEKVEELWSKGILPIVVGGSLFYIRSLFFPPVEEVGGHRPVVRSLGEGGWKKLHEIDPERAKAILPGDTYRIQRALDIWEATGKKPSEYEPEFNPGFHARILFVNPPREVLYDRINKRTELMMQGERGGWIGEVRALKGTPWQPFLKMKKLIGYPEIFAWLDLPEDEQKKQYPALIKDIQQKTRNYAKRQVTFWKKFRILCTMAGSRWRCQTETVLNGGRDVVEHVVNQIRGDVKNKQAM